MLTMTAAQKELLESAFRLGWLAALNKLTEALADRGVDGTESALQERASLSQEAIEWMKMPPTYRETMEKGKR